MNRHAAYVREIPASRCAVLFVHGILGTPRFFDFLLPDIPPDWTVHNVLLSGHGGDVRDFSHASMAAWRRQVASELSALSAAHERVIVCGHSMGTLLAIDAACAHPEQVQGLLLLAVPLRLSLNARSCLRSTALALGMRSAGREEAQALIRAYGVSADRHVWRYAGWAPRYLELFGEIAAVRRMLPDLKPPAWRCSQPGTRWSPAARWAVWPAAPPCKRCCCRIPGTMPTPRRMKSAFIRH